MDLTHLGRVTHICVSKLTIIGSDNGLSPGRRQAIIWTNTKILLIRTLGTNFSEILIAIHVFLFKKMPLKMSSAKWRPFRLGLNVLTLVIPGRKQGAPHRPGHFYVSRHDHLYCAGHLRGHYRWYLRTHGRCYLRRSLPSICLFPIFPTHERLWCLCGLCRWSDVALSEWRTIVASGSSN